MYFESKIVRWHNDYKRQQNEEIRLYRPYRCVCGLCVWVVCMCVCVRVYTRNIEILCRIYIPFPKIENTRIHIIQSRFFQSVNELTTNLHSDIYNGKITSNCSSTRQPFPSFNFLCVAGNHQLPRPPAVCLMFSHFASEIYPVMCLCTHQFYLLHIVCA